MDTMITGQMAENATVRDETHKTYRDLNAVKEVDGAGWKLTQRTMNDKEGKRIDEVCHM